MANVASAASFDRPARVQRATSPFRQSADDTSFGFTCFFSRFSGDWPTLLANEASNFLTSTTRSRGLEARRRVREDVGGRRRGVEIARDARRSTRGAGGAKPCTERTPSSSLRLLI